MSFTPEIELQIKTELQEAEKGQKSRLVCQWAAALKCSPKKIWALQETKMVRRKSPNTSLTDVTKIVYQVKFKVPDSADPLSTDQAYAIACKNNLLPEDAPKFHPGTINRCAREGRLNKTARRIQRFQAERPNQLHHVDMSTSQFLHVVKALPNDDYQLKLHEGSSQNYKNKPLLIKLKLCIYGVVDDYSGCLAARYVAAPGESAANNLNFLSWAWAKTGDKTLHGLPESIKGDKGPMMRGKMAEDLFARLGVTIDPSEPGAKDAHGKIERPWRTIWQRFEKQFLAVDDRKKFEITISELNRQFLIFLDTEYNRRDHRYEKGVTREQMWKRITLAKNGGVRPLPEGAFSTTCAQIERKVGRDGTFRLDNELFEVKGLHDARVRVIKGVFTDDIIVQDVETGEKYEVIPFKPNPVGTFTAHPHTEHQKNVKAAKDLQITPTLFQEKKRDEKIINLPIRTQDEQPFDPVFNIRIDTFSSTEEAMRYFMEKSGEFPLKGSDDWAALEQKITQNGHCRQYVDELIQKVILGREDEKRRLAHG
ncbi:MAG: hypothetical protein PHI97_33210 [Desulfobulbus sp.]|nr:hypothetical protein [Desulfobulbus sp.]